MSQEQVSVSERGFVVATATELQVLVEEHTDYLEGEDLSELTIRSYRWNLDRLVIWLANRGTVKLSALSGTLLREWAVSLKKDNGWAPATRKQAISAARSFLRYCDLGELADELQTPKDRRRVQRTIYPQEVADMLVACDPDRMKGVRDQAIISLLFDSGIRAAELCRLKLRDVDVRGRGFKVIIKGGDQERGWFGEVTAERLVAWLDMRMAHSNVLELFVSVGGNTPGCRLTGRGLYEIIKKIGDRAGVDKASVHAFRRGFAVKLSEDGVPDNVLKDLGRWEDVKMIKRYTAGMNAGRLFPQYSPMDHLGH